MKFNSLDNSIDEINRQQLLIKKLAKLINAVENPVVSTIENNKKININNSSTGPDSSNNILFEEHNTLFEDKRNSYFENKKWFQYFFFKNPINLLFSIDQFLFEFAKKQPQRKKSSEFQQQLKEKKKILLFYGFLSKKQLSKIVKNALLYQGYFSKNFFSLLVRRLDVILYRSNFAKNILVARQLVNHKKILVNNKIINIPSYTVNPGDIITINPENFQQIGNDILKLLKKNFKKRSSRLTISSNFFQKLNNGQKTTKNQIDLKERLTTLIKFLIKKTETRAYIKSQKNLLFANKKANPVLFTLFKIKPLISPQAKFNIFSLIQQNYLTTKKKPNFYINGNFDLKNEFFKRESVSPIYSQKAFLKDSLVQKESFLNTREITDKKIHLLFKRNLFQIAMSLNSEEIFNELSLLKLKKYFIKKRSQRQIKKSLRFYGLKPLNLEISYNILTIIYLYSPQRLYFPFFINTDLILRSCN